MPNIPVAKVLLLKRKMDFDFENFDRTDCTLLIKMVKGGRLLGVEHLLITEGRKGNLLNLLRTTDRQGFSALHYAVSLGYPEIVRKLLQHCDSTDEFIDIESYARSTALLLACKSKYELSVKADMVGTLLDAGADPNLPKEDPFARPLLVALEKKWWEGAWLLLNAGASATDTDFQHDLIPPVYLAMDSLKTVQLMASKGCMAIVTYDGRTLLHWLLDVTTNNPLDNLGYSKDHIVSLVNVILTHNKTAVTLQGLYTAARYGHFTALQLMLQSLDLLSPSAFDAALLALHLAQHVMSEDTVETFLKDLIHSINPRSSYHDSRGVYWKYMMLLLVCHKDYLNLLITEAENHGLPVATWGCAWKLADELPWPLQEIQLRFDLRYCAHHVTKMECREQNPLTLFLLYSHKGEDTSRVVKILLEKGVRVEPVTFMALFLSNDHKQEEFFNPYAWPSQCFKALLKAFVEQKSDLRSLEMVQVCVSLMQLPGCLYLMLREGLPVEPFIYLKHPYPTIAWPGVPDCPEKSRLYLHSICIASLFVDRLPKRLFNILIWYTDGPGVESLKARLMKDKGNVSSLQHLCRVAIRRSVAGHHVQSRLLQLAPLVSRPAMDLLLYNDQFFDDVSEFQERPLPQNELDDNEDD